MSPEPRVPHSSSVHASAGGPPTMQSIADKLGVSRQLVSLVLRNQPGASQETRRRVAEMAEQLGYHPNASARALSGKRSRRLGVVFTMRQPFEVDLVEALFDAAKEREFTLVLAPITPQRGQGSVFAELLGQRVEGVLVLGTDNGAARIRDLPKEVPSVMLGGPKSDESADDVRVDDATGIALVMDHLFGLGHRRISHITGGAGPNSHDRAVAYESAMTAQGLEEFVDVIEADYSETGGGHATSRLIDRPNRPTAIVGGNDRVAMGTLGTLLRRGIRVPEDMSVTGFDNASLAQVPYLDLTTVAYDPTSLAERAVDALVARIQDPNAEPVLHRQEPVLVVRSSTAPPPETR